MKLGRTLIYVALILIVALALYYFLVVNGSDAANDAAPVTAEILEVSSAFMVTLPE